MGTEVEISFVALRAQLESEKSNLCKIDEDIKKIVHTGRFNDRYNNNSGDYNRGVPRPGGRNSFHDMQNNFKNGELGKRKHETKTVFSRLSARAHDSDGEDDGICLKRNKVSSTVSREMPTRAAVLRAQGDDAQTRTRNKRMFGSLLGTLQKFKQEEIVLQTKEEKKAQVERKIEEQARIEKEREVKERKTLFAEREYKKATIKALEVKMNRVQEFEKWEMTQKKLGNFILTKAKPHIYWIPKKMSDKANQKLASSRKYNEKCLDKKRQELQEELQRIEQRVLRPKMAQVKENDPASNIDGYHQAKLEHAESDGFDKDDDDVKKRDKFAMDVDMKEKEDSDGEERHEECEEKLKDQEETVSDENKMDTTVKVEQGKADGFELTRTEIEPMETTASDESHTTSREESHQNQTEPSEPIAPCDTSMEHIEK